MITFPLFSSFSLSGLVGYLRPEKKFAGLDPLLAAINNDIAVAKELEIESNEENLLKRTKLSSMNNALETTMYILGERRMKIMDFLSMPRDDKFDQNFQCQRSTNDDTALWCNMMIE